MCVREKEGEKERETDRESKGKLPHGHGNRWIFHLSVDRSEACRWGDIRYHSDRIATHQQSALVTANGKLYWTLPWTHRFG